MSIWKLLAPVSSSNSTRNLGSIPAFSPMRMPSANTAQVGHADEVAIISFNRRSCFNLSHVVNWRTDNIKHLLHFFINFFFPADKNRPLRLFPPEPEFFLRGHSKKLIPFASAASDSFTSCLWIYCTHIDIGRSRFHCIQQPVFTQHYFFQVFWQRQTGKDNIRVSQFLHIFCCFSGRAGVQSPLNGFQTQVKDKDFFACANQIVGPDRRPWPLHQ